MKITTVKEFIERRVQPEHCAIVALIRRMMRELAPQAKEVVTYGILGWKGNKMLAVISPTKKDITFAFSRGAEFQDRYKLLRGVGRVSKNIRIADVKEVNRTVLGYYIKQALKLDKAK